MGLLRRYRISQFGLDITSILFTTCVSLVIVSYKCLVQLFLTHILRILEAVRMYCQVGIEFSPEALVSQYVMLVAEIERRPAIFGHSLQQQDVDDNLATQIGENDALLIVRLI
ncbi:hypothetical protein CI102_332 [Trichoderma harzianum]|nr:hypothetical protein CI102_332 [Trichoderma harzianum]